MKKQLKALLRKLIPRPEVSGKGLNDPSCERTDASYGVCYLEHNIPTHLPAKSVYPARVILENTGQMTWRSAPADGCVVALNIRYGANIVATLMLPCTEVRPCERVTVRFALNAPSVPGAVTIHMEMVEFNVTLFGDRGVAPLTLDMMIDPPLEDPHDEAWDIALRRNPWHFQPTRGISRGAEGRHYPILAHRAKGCRLWDLAGHEYIDFIMGWGSTLLGYADDRVQRAIIEAVELTAPVIPYPHPFELEVTEMLCEDFPSAEMAIFGKNGSDVCTLAARIARVLTGRKTILYSGYHGWQDFWIEQMGFGRTGVPDRPVPLIRRFKFNDRADFSRLYEQYKHDLAAVMLEPSGPLGSDEIGFEADANRDFLQYIAAATRDAGAFLVFDEIITGYRYPHGSVQKATDVVPDMTCLGKALASGMPLSALVGRSNILLEGMPKTRYAPTFKGEIYSFAAARAAIKVYRSEPVAEYVWNYGLRLKQGINELCCQNGVSAVCTGTPFRMMLVFQDANHERLALKKTLYYQELLVRGLCTYNGIMLPSYAHDEDVLQRTLSIVGEALESVAQAERKNDFDSRLEIPPLSDII